MATKRRGPRTIKELLETPRDKCPPNAIRIYDELIERKRKEEEFEKMLSEIVEDRLEGSEEKNNGKPRSNHTVGELRKIKDPKNLDWREYKTWKSIQEEQSYDIDIRDWYEMKIRDDSGVGTSN